MFKGFQDTSKGSLFKGFPNLNFQMNNSAYGFSGCTFWLDAAYGLNTQTDLAAVSEWVDRIGGIKFVQATGANQPILVLSHASYNNLPVVNFQSNTRFLQSTIGVPFKTIAFIANYDSTNSINTVLGATTNAMSIHLATSATSGVGARTASTLFMNGATARNTSPKIVIMTSTDIVLNGASDLNQAEDTRFYFSVDRIGYRGDVTTTALIGNIAEIIFYENKFTSEQMITLSTNINSKYAIY